MNYRAGCQGKNSIPHLLFSGSSNRSSSARELRRSGICRPSCRLLSTRPWPFRQMVKRGQNLHFCEYHQEGIVYYSLLPYCKTMMWLAVDMSGATDGDTASLWHKMLSRTCCRVRNGGSCCPRHVISTWTYTHFLQFQFQYCRWKPNFFREQAGRHHIKHSLFLKWCAYDSTLMYWCLWIVTKLTNKPQVTSGFQVKQKKTGHQLLWGEDGRKHALLLVRVR